MTDNEQVKKAAELAEIIKIALEDKKGIDPTLLEVGKQTILADFFVVCTGTSNTHVKALADEVEFKTNEALGIKPNHIEGFSDNTWTLMDYGSVIVHIFTREGREFYKLEKLWKDASAEKVKEIENSKDE
ncbi:MAG: ribosome silencing factor [Clostridiales bacterium GWF2_36_10]|nr:MAG: ribosome silencing factor [Clostridiales bacterium GWF2_36_10]HAN22050.1 ribosome silencing factor [Clostridiales bacterium]